MKTLLVNPPHSNPTSPPLGLAVLCSHLRALRHEVEIHDVSISSLRKFLEWRTVQNWLGKAREDIVVLEQKDALSYTEQRRYSELVQATLHFEHYSGRVSDALAVQCDPVAFQDRVIRGDAHCILNRILESIGAVVGDTDLNTADYRCLLSPFSSTDLSHVAHEGNNLYQTFINEWAASIDWADVGVVGISISYAKQMIPTILIASAIMRASSDTWIILGGSLLAHMNNEHIVRLLDYCHGIIRWEGEIAMSLVLDARRDGRRLTGELGILCRNRDGTVMSPSRVPGVNLDQAPTPDFRGFPLESYLMPHKVLPLQVGRGCYWGKCTFCCLSTAFREHGHWRSPKRVAEDMQTLSTRHGVRCFEFVDDALPPAYAKGLSRAIAARGLDIRWFCYGRLDPAFSLDLLKEMKESGCTSIKFGLESASQPVLRQMRKGIRVKMAERLLAHTKQAGIVPQVAFFIGFPGEGTEDVARTLSFVENHVLPAGVVAFNGQFRILSSMEVFQKPEVFGIRKFEKWNIDEDLMDYFVMDAEKTLLGEELANCVAATQRRLAGSINHDFARTVDLRRFFFLPVEPLSQYGPADGEPWIMKAPFDLTRIRSLTDLNNGDFSPGEGIYRTRSYVVRNAHCENHLQSLSRLVPRLPRQSLTDYVFDPVTRVFSQR